MNIDKQIAKTKAAYDRLKTERAILNHEWNRNERDLCKLYAAENSGKGDAKKIREMEHLLVKIESALDKFGS